MGIFDAVVLVLIALVVGFVVDLFVAKRPWAWLLTMVAAALGGGAAGYSIGTIYPFVGNLSLWPALIGAIAAALVMRVLLRVTQRTARRV